MKYFFKKNNFLKLLKEIVLMTSGCFIYAFAINEFFVPNKLAEGGVTGISLVLFYLSGISVSKTYLLINIPIAIIGFKMLGKEFIIKTIYGIFMMSYALKITEGVGQPLDDILLGSLFGGFLSGLGLGIVFLAGGSTGGMDIIARIMTRYRGIPVGKALLIIDFFVLLVAGFLFGKVIFMYTLVALFVAAKIIDLIEDGKHVAKTVTVISKKPQEIKDFVIKELDRSCTVINTRGAYMNRDQEMLYIILSRYQIMKFKTFMKYTDPEAFITIGDVSEVLGDGFKNIREH
ncbi:MAG: YitT family protein [Fusobacteriaceae bacterium]